MKQRELLLVNLVFAVGSGIGWLLAIVAIAAIKRNQIFTCACCFTWLGHSIYYGLNGPCIYEFYGNSPLN